ncbi:hypothetical protein CTheo_1767 [Ceratobasidium theobromae]|uniref:Transmembrane protein n=1 Tax=Ceratobasidium theobromae TaxID=1582974 RepID=A0A5N5QT12_9AGAM|nr:hypothetical protein CTheo_1767 [Ceratobasidium theobromae]
MTDTTKHTVFPASKAGKHLANLFIASCVFGLISFGFSMALFGAGSLWLIHAAFGVTLIHHVTVRCLIVKKTEPDVFDGNSPAGLRFGSLRHAFNICFMVFIALAWLAGGILSITFQRLNMWELWYDQDPSAYVVADLAADGAAIIESGLLMAIAVFSWKLRNEAAWERSKVGSVEKV